MKGLLGFVCYFVLVLTKVSLSVYPELLILRKVLRAGGTFKKEGIYT